MSRKRPSERKPLLSPVHSTVSEYANVEHDPQLGGPKDREKLEKALLRKLDLRMSILVVVYVLNFIDRNSVAAARLRGFEHDLALKGSQFASITSILYIGYSLMQVPSNMFLSHMRRPSLYLSCCSIAWGFVSACIGFVTSYQGALITRFLLGFVEAAFFPGALFLISRWYKRSELSQRTAILACGISISGAFGSLIASGILDLMDGVLGYTAWRWLFFVEGGLTITVGILSLLTLPDFPEYKASWLTPAEQALAQQRMNEDAATCDPKAVGCETLQHSDGPIADLLLVIRDWKVWWLAALFTFILFSFSFSLYFPTLCETMGYNPTITLLLCAPPHISAALFTFWVCRHSDKVGERCMHVVIPLCIGIGGFIIAMSTMNIYIRYFSLFPMAMSLAGLICFLAWVSSSVSNPPAKRAVGIALINAIAQSGSIIGSYAWPLSWGPTYNKSYGICIATRLVAILMIFTFRWVLMRLNKEMDVNETRRGGRPIDSGKGWRYQI